jgi:hypothetical protein
MLRMKRLWLLAALVHLSFSPGKADSIYLLATVAGLAWGNTDPSSAVPPASFMVWLGACPSATVGCGPLSDQTYLNPISFLPSASSQSVTITAANDPDFSAVASAIESGFFDASISRFLSFTDTDPAGIGSQSESGLYTVPPGAAIVSIVATIGPFSFQPYQYLDPEPGGGFIWAVQSNSSPVIQAWDPGTSPSNWPELTFAVYAAGSQPASPAIAPEPSCFILVGAGIAGLYLLRRNTSAQAKAR